MTNALAQAAAAVAILALLVGIRAAPRALVRWLGRDLPSKAVR